MDFGSADGATYETLLTLAVPSTLGALHQGNNGTQSGPGVQHGVERDEIAVQPRAVPVAGGRSCPMKMKYTVSGGAVAVASLEGLIKFYMLAPRIYHSIVKRAEKERCDLFSTYLILAVAARRLYHNFTKKMGALVPIDANWETAASGSDSFEA